MSLKKMYIIAATLPHPGRYITLKGYRNESLRKWDKDVQDLYTNLLKNLAEGKGTPEGMTPLQATLKTLPYFIDLSVERVSVPKEFSEEDSVVDIVGIPENLVILPISKGPRFPEWTQEFLDELGMTSEQLQEMKVRSSRAFLERLARHPNPCSTPLKLITIPLGIEVKLSHNLRGEFVREVPRIWA